MEVIRMEATTKRRRVSTISEAGAADEVVKEKPGLCPPVDKSAAAEGIKAFHSDTIKKLRDRLFREINSSAPLNSLYVVVNAKVNAGALHVAFMESWLKVDLTHFSPDADADAGRGEVYFSHADLIMTETSNHPKELSGLECYGYSVWKSKIMIVGGKTRVTDSPSSVTPNCSDKIYLYDTLEKNWETHTMKNRRGCNPIVVVAEDKVFIFDGNPDQADYYDSCAAESEEDESESEEDESEMYGDDDVSEFSGFLDKMKIERYSEYFVFNSSGTPMPSEYLPQQKNNFPQISSELDRTPHYSYAVYPNRSRFLSYAVYPNRTRILIWVSERHIVFLDYKTCVWDTYLELDNMPSPFHNTKFTNKLFKASLRCNRFPVLEDFLFWTDNKSIYAFDLSKFTALPVYSFPHLIASFDSSTYPLHNTLVPVGNGMLCLLLNTTLYRNIYCAIFRVLISKGTDEEDYIHLFLVRDGYLETPYVSMRRAFSVSTS